MSSDDDERLYEEHVLRHFEEPYHRGLLAGATHRWRIDNPVCGDSVRIELLVTEADVIEQAWFTGSGCIISQAAASMLAEHIGGKSCDAVRAFSAQDMLGLFRAPLTLHRQQCCLLGWRVLQATIAPLK